MRLRRPFAAGSTLGLLAHNAFETRAGLGIVFEPQLGRRGASMLWSGVVPVSLLATARGGRWGARLSAFNAGIGLAGVAVHFKLWPWSLHAGLPMLDEAEGLREDQLPAYNAILLAWGASSAISLLRETRRGSRGFAVAGLLHFPILVASARHHFRWVREQAQLEPDPARVSAHLWADTHTQPSFD